MFRNGDTVYIRSGTFEGSYAKIDCVYVTLGRLLPSNLRDVRLSIDVAMSYFYVSVGCLEPLVSACIVSDLCKNH